MKKELVGYVPEENTIILFLITPTRPGYYKLEIETIDGSVVVSQEITSLEFSEHVVKIGEL